MNYNRSASQRQQLNKPTKNIVYTTVNDRKTPIQRTVKRKIRPEPFPQSNDTSSNEGNTFEQKIIKTRLLESLFASTPLASRSKLRGLNTKDSECIILSYEFKNSPNGMIFLPNSFENILSKEYTCRGCFQVYSLLSLKQRDIESLPSFELVKLKPTFDPRTLPHYCIHIKSFYTEIAYFNEFEPHMNNDCNVSLIDLTFMCGMYMTRMGEVHKKVTNFMNTTKPKLLALVTKFLLSLNSAIKNESQAISFLHCFRHFHTNHNKQPPLLDSKCSLDDVLVDEEDADSSDSSTQSHYEVLTWKQILSEEEELIDFKSMPSWEICSVPGHKNSKTDHQVSSLKRLSQKPPPPIPSDIELTAVINRLIACNEVNVNSNSFAESAKSIRLLVLYYAPSRASEFDKITKEVLSRLKPGTNVKS